MTNFARCARFSAVLTMASATAALAGDRARIDIVDLDFSPPSATLHVGDMVEWVNEDIVEHTATARNGEFDVVTPVGKSARLRPKRVGDFAYYCRFHPNMIGTLHVLARGGK